VAAVAGAAAGVAHLLAERARGGEVGQFRAVDDHQVHGVEATGLEPRCVGQVVDVDRRGAGRLRHAAMLALRDADPASRNRDARPHDPVPARGAVALDRAASGARRADARGAIGRGADWRRTGRRPLRRRQRQARRDPDPGRTPAGDRGAGRTRRGRAGDPAPQPGRLRHRAGGVAWPALPRRRGAAGRDRQLRPVFAHGAGARPGRLQRPARHGGAVRARARGRHAADRRCGGVGGGMSARGHCILAHGFESGPGATKVTALAKVAERLGWSHERPDYTDLDARTDVSRLGDVAARVARLQALAQAAAARGPLVLAGSSLGAWISGQVSLRVPVRALFLMAPPTRMGEAPPLQAAEVPTSIVHGWRDELIDAMHVVEWARARRATLLLVDDSHRLEANVETSAQAFARLLERLP